MDRLIHLFLTHPLSFCAEASALLPIVIGLIGWRQASRAVRYVVIFFILHFARDFTSTLLAYYKIYNIFIYNAFSFVEIPILYLIYANIEQISARWYYRVALYGGSIALLTSLFFFKVDEFSTGDFSIVWIYGIVLVMSFYAELLTQLYIKNILTYSMFWISSGLLLYFCGTFFIFLLSDVVLSTKAASKTFLQYWHINLIFYMILSTMASVGLWFSKYDHQNRHALA